MESFRYQAFISYSHADLAWARWLHRALESYRIPKRLRRERELPARIAPVFKDLEELPTASSLSGVITEALENSRCLIVICSPHAARSTWVNEEVTLFRKLGRAERIFCLIVDGDPAAAPDSAGACFVPALRDSEPLAADARAEGDGRSNAKLKLVAGILGVGLDALRQRDMQRRMKRLWLITATSAVAVVATTTLALVAVVASREAERQRVIAEQQAETASRTTEFLVNLFSVVDPTEARGRHITAYEILEKGRQNIDRGLAGQPEVRNQLQTTMGRVYTGLGLYDTALTLLEDAYDELPQLSNEVAYGNTLYLRGEYQRAAGVFGQAVDRVEQASDSDWRQMYSDALGGLAAVYIELDRLDDAETLYRRVVRRDRETWPGGHAQIAKSLGGLATTLLFKGDYDGAEENFRLALEENRTSNGDDHPATVETLLNLGSVYFFRGEKDRALASWADALPYYRQIYGDDHPELATLLNNVGRIHLERGELDIAEQHLSESIRIDYALGRERHEDLVFALNNLGLTKAGLGDTDAAFDLFQEALDLARSTGHRLAGPIIVHRALLQCTEAPIADVVAELEGATPLLQADYDADSWRFTLQRYTLAFCRGRLGEKGAEQALQSAADELTRQLGADHFFVSFTNGLHAQFPAKD